MRSIQEIYDQVDKNDPQSIQNAINEISNHPEKDKEIKRVGIFLEILLLLLKVLKLFK
jgi:hypothetical protein